jgi:uncharacterized membrane protein
MTEKTIKNGFSDTSDDLNKFQGDIVLPIELKEILEDKSIPETKRKIILHAFSVTTASSFRGPIPSPHLLKGYNETIPDGAERIMRKFEQQSEHRMGLEKHVVHEELRQSGRGQLFGFILGLVGLGLATYLAMYGHETIAGIFGATTILGLVAVFVIGRKEQKKDLAEKETKEGS